MSAFYMGRRVKRSTGMPIFVTLAPRTVEAVFGGPLGTGSPHVQSEGGPGAVGTDSAADCHIWRCQQVADLPDQVVNAESGPGLPPERELAASLGVGRSAIRGALAALEILGIVEVRPGSTLRRRDDLELLPQALSWGMLVNPDSTEDLIQIRTQLETSVARLRRREAQRRGPGLPGRVRRRPGGRWPGRPRLRHRKDFPIPRPDATIAGNPILQQMLSTVRLLLRLWADRSVQIGQQMTQTIADHTRPPGRHPRRSAGGGSRSHGSAHGHRGRPAASVWAGGEDAPGA